MRLKVIAKLEEITGGKVELKGFQWNLSKLQFEADDLTIHGLEPAGEVPYAHADHLQIQSRSSPCSAVRSVCAMPASNVL